MKIKPYVWMDQSGAPLAVSLSCDINTGKNQSDCTNCLKCLRIPNNATQSNKWMSILSHKLFCWIIVLYKMIKWSVSICKPWKTCKLYTVYSVVVSLLYAVSPRLISLMVMVSPHTWAQVDEFNLNHPWQSDTCKRVSSVFSVLPWHAVLLYSRYKWVYPS